jgi:hypothetical protein
MIGKVPFGDWELVLPDTEEMLAHFANEDVLDVLLIVTYGGRTAG